MNALLRASTGSFQENEMANIHTFAIKKLS